jgi:hypothetical protein
MSGVIYKGIRPFIYYRLIRDILLFFAQAINPPKNRSDYSGRFFLFALVFQLRTITLHHISKLTFHPSQTHLSPLPTQLSRLPTND